MKHKILLPYIGKQTGTITVLSWWKNENERIDKGDSLLTVQTSGRELFAVRSQVRGVLTAKRVKAGDVVSPNKLLGEVEELSPRPSWLAALKNALKSVSSPAQPIPASEQVQDGSSRVLTATAGATSATFLCYRRDDTQDAAGRLHDRLIETYGADRVFMDIDSIPAGVDFMDFVTTHVASCRAVIVMIGRNWLNAVDRHGRRRLEDVNDLVRVEIATAIAQRILTIPVLVQNASMPSTDELPEDLRPLARRHAIELTPTRWRADVERLIKELDRVMKG